ncbi:MAG: hypothetical protein AVDCRST_MAG75-2754 [uncultured Propionibacteriaceae bacterium]|uniref:TadE-like domain-containing protein n=1 Tax=uncultured Propionibacteriaceae bacterium TaxID=257457 RepID=A0A6J4PCW6_9ACTN|nr:MAG: hypothetical protein AVDCRST_MAG75-2754 [uncultured Propionibacteriaceae bacterium]
MELAVLIPGLIVVLGLMVVGGRLWFARSTVTEAAYNAARAASLARTAAQAASDGPTAGTRALATDGLACSPAVVTVSTEAFVVPVGQPATVTSTVSCRVVFSDVLLPGMPGSLVIRSTGAAALDTYRSR